ncbi:MAG TPA: HAD family hydrolase [Vicinamibacteria bacterium]|nr:HAD family hydrolase [Vicinamibacteria bacterium]
MSTRVLPFESLKTVFLDVGNTLVSMDYAWISHELEARGIEASTERVWRAEAASRPVVSAALSGSASTEGVPIFALYLRTILEKLHVSSGLAELVDELVPVFRAPGREKLWSYVLPGVPEALADMRALGLRLVVVSNSDGTVENVLVQQGLRGHLDAVFDSHLVGFEKPDPRFFQHALETTGARPESTLHVGDIYAADVVGGRSAGLHTALLDPFDDWTLADCPRYPDLKALAAAFHRIRKLRET